MVIKKYLNSLPLKGMANAPWMLGEQFVKMVSGILISIYIARYLGPEQYGVLSYVIAFVAVFYPIAQMGMSSILVRELLKFPENKKQILSSSFYLVLVSSIFVFVLVNTLSFFLNKSDLVKFFIFVYSIGVLFKPFDIIDFSFQASFQVKFASKAKTLAIILMALVKLGLIYFECSLGYFILAYALDFLILALFLGIIHFSKKEYNFFNKWDNELLKGLFSSAWPMMLASFSVVLYMKMDQLIINFILGNKELGLYSSSVRLYDGFLGFMLTLTMALLPTIIKLKAESSTKYRIGLTKLFSFVFWFNNIVALIVTIFREIIVNILYGKDYIESQYVLALIFWSAGLSSVGSVTARFFTAENMERKMFKRTILSLFINLILNFILIPIYGIEGSAIATILTLIVGNYLLDYFDKDLKVLVDIKNRAFLSVFTNKFS